MTKAATAKAPADKSPDLRGLRFKLSLEWSKSDAKQGRLDEAWNRLSGETAELMRHSDPVKHANLQQAFHFLRQEVSRTCVESHLSQNRLQAARRWLARCLAILAGSPEYNGKAGQQSKLNELVQRALGPDQSEVTPFHRQLDQCERAVNHALKGDSVERVALESALAVSQSRGLNESRSLVLPEFSFNLESDVEVELNRRVAVLTQQRRQAAQAEAVAKLVRVWPQGIEQPVHSQAFRLVKMGRATATQADIKLWDDLQSRLEHLQALHLFELALRLAGEARGDHDHRVADLLKRAVAWDPSLVTQTVALLGVTSLSPPTGREALLARLHTYALRRAEVAGSPGAIQSGNLADLEREFHVGIAHVADLLRRQTQTQPPYCDGWTATQYLAKVMNPVLKRGTLLELDSLEEVVRVWITAWHSRFDPRHPGWQLLHDIQISQLLRRAEEELGTSATGSHHADSAAHACEAIELGIYRRSQALRAAKVYAISQCANSNLKRRREILISVISDAKRQLASSNERFAAHSKQRDALLAQDDVDRWLAKAENLAVAH